MTNLIYLEEYSSKTIVLNYQAHAESALWITVWRSKSYFGNNKENSKLLSPRGGPNPFDSLFSNPTP